MSDHICKIEVYWHKTSNVISLWCLKCPSVGYRIDKRFTLYRAKGYIRRNYGLREWERVESAYKKGQEYIKNPENFTDIGVLIDFDLYRIS